MSELSRQHRGLCCRPACFRVYQCWLHRDGFFVRGAFLRFLVHTRTCGRYLTKAICLLYYQHELRECKRLQSFIQWHWRAVGGYIKAPYLSPPPILMRNRTHQPWLNLPSVCLFFLSFAGLWFVCVFVVLYICLCKVAPWCQGPKFVEFYVRSNCSKALFHLTWQASDFWRRLTERQIAD